MKNRLLSTIFVLLLFVSVAANAQKLPNLTKKPVLKFEFPSFCPARGADNSEDKDLNRVKNRIDVRSCFKTQDIRSIDYQFINLNKISCEQKISD